MGCEATTKVDYNKSTENRAQKYPLAVLRNLESFRRWPHMTIICRYVLNGECSTKYDFLPGPRDRKTPDEGLSRQSGDHLPRSIKLATAPLGHVVESSELTIEHISYREYGV